MSALTSEGSRPCSAESRSMVGRKGAARRATVREGRFMQRMRARGERVPRALAWTCQSSRRSKRRRAGRSCSGAVAIWGKPTPRIANGSGARSRESRPAASAALDGPNTPLSSSAGEASKACLEPSVRKVCFARASGAKDSPASRSPPASAQPPASDSKRQLASSRTATHRAEPLATAFPSHAPIAPVAMLESALSEVGSEV